MIWQALLQFLWRLTFGVALGMAITPASRVPSGFFRVHMWVLMGLYTLAVLALSPLGPESTAATRGWMFYLALGCAVISYVGSVIWLYERAVAGKIALGVLVIAGWLIASLHEATLLQHGSSWAAADAGTAGGLLGMTLTAMLLGHWYLNSPGMQLGPLRRLLIGMAIALALRAAVCGLGLALQVATEPAMGTTWWLFVALRWLAGVVLTTVLVVLTWRTLKVPNTQSATGILYAAVILVFIGELMSQLLSTEGRFPL